MGGGFIEFLFTGGGASRRAERYERAAPAPLYVEPSLPPEEDVRYRQRRGARFLDEDGPRYEPEPEERSYPLFARAEPGELRRAGEHRPVDPRFRPQIVSYDTREPVGTIVVDTPNRFLYLVQEGGRAKRYGIGVGRPGFTWAGVKSITQKREWPDWRPPEQMLQRQPNLPRYMPGGPDNPLGARALYLGSSLYRIHGSNEPWTIGQSVSSGCIRMRNEDVIDLYERVRVGARVVVI